MNCNPNAAELDCDEAGIPTVLGMPAALTIADGQVGTGPTLISTGPPDDGHGVLGWGIPIQATFTSIGTDEVTMTVSVARNGGGTRRMRRVVFRPGDSFTIAGVRLNAADQLLAQADIAASIDYIVANGHRDDELRSRKYDADGFEFAGAIVPTD